MAVRIWRKIGVILLTILKGMLQTIFVILKLFAGVAKLFLLLLSFAARIILSFVGIAARP